MEEFFSALFDAAIYAVAWIAPVIYVFAASVIVYSVGGANKRVSAWLGWLFAAVGVLLVALLYIVL